MKYIAVIMVALFSTTALACEDHGTDALEAMSIGALLYLDEKCAIGIGATKLQKYINANIVSSARGYLAGSMAEMTAGDLNCNQARLTATGLGLTK